MPVSQFVIKIGGKASESEKLVSALADEMNSFASNGDRFILVHGGGITISELQSRYSIIPLFLNGLRQTPPAEMPLVDMALAGRVNKHLVRIMRKRGLDAWGLSGADAGVILAESMSGNAQENRTGRCVELRRAPLELLLNNGYIPVLSPPSSDSEGRGINVNADEAAFAVASSFPADNLVFFSDVPGVIENERIIPQLDPEGIEEKIEAGVISGGMIPKVRSAVSALHRGIRAVRIGEYSFPGSLKRILDGETGTTITMNDSRRNNH